MNTNTHPIHHTEAPALAAAGASPGATLQKAAPHEQTAAQAHLTALNERLAHRLLQAGVVLFLLGLLTGFAIPMLKNPRMGLASHLEGVLNGIFLIALALFWHKLRLGKRMLRLTFWTALYGTMANWLATLLAAAWGASRMTPIAGKGYEAVPIQESIIAFLLMSLSLAMVALCAFILYGLRGGGVKVTP